MSGKSGSQINADYTPCLVSDAALALTFAAKILA